MVVRDVSSPSESTRRICPSSSDFFFLRPAARLNRAAFSPSLGKFGGVAKSTGETPSSPALRMPVELLLDLTAVRGIPSICMLLYELMFDKGMKPCVEECVDIASTYTGACSLGYGPTVRLVK